LRPSHEPVVAAELRTHLRECPARVSAVVLADEIDGISEYLVLGFLALDPRDETCLVVTWTELLWARRRSPTVAHEAIFAHRLASVAPLLSRTPATSWSVGRKDLDLGDTGGAGRT
jgi:hypothetical protein